MKTYWNNSASGSFFVAANWSTGHVPGVNDIAAMTLPGTRTITDAIGTTVLGVTTGAGTTFDIASDATFTATEGTATGANSGHIAITDGSTFNVGNTVNNPGVINLNASADSTTLAFTTATTLKGDGEVILTDSLNNAISYAGTLTNVDNLIEGSGTIAPSSSSPFIALLNEKQGVILADGATQALVIDGALADNFGLLEGDSTAGLVIEDSFVENAGIIEAEFGWVVDLTNTEVFGGTVEALGTGMINAGGNDELAGSGSIADPLVLKGSFNIDNGADVATFGVIDNTGTITLEAAGSLTGISIGAVGETSPVTTLEGGGNVTLTNNADNFIDAAAGLAGFAVLNNVNNTISGAGTIGASDELKLNNEKLGVVDATSASLMLHIDATINNAGLIEATGHAGLQLVGYVDNVGGIIQAGTGSSVYLAGGVTGGTLKTVGSGVMYSDGGVLDGTNESVAGNKMIVNAGTLIVPNSEILILAGTIDNTGEISLDSTGSVTAISLGIGEGKSPTPTETLEGGGRVVMSDNNQNIITGQGGPATLVNFSDKISGAGTIGLNGLILHNDTDGLIDATGGVPLIINTGATAIANAGTLQADSGSTLYLGSNVNNSGTLKANGGVITASGSVTGGSASIIGAGEIEFGGASATSVTFATGSTGELVLDDSRQYTGTISGFKTTQSIDLADISAGTATFSLSGHELTINDHVGDVAHLKFSGTLGTFSISDDGGGGTLLTDPPAAAASAKHRMHAGGHKAVANVALLGSYIAAMSTASDAIFGRLPTADAPLTNPPALAVPHG